MNIQNQNIYPDEIRRLILNLISFFGAQNIEVALKSYEKSLSTSGPMFRDYYLRTRHPWWDAFVTFNALEKNGKSIKKHLSDGLERLAGDAKKILILQKLMSSKVREKYKRDLLDENRAFDYLFELETAWHYYLNGHCITWYDEDGRPDLKVTTPVLEFDIECKRLTVDASRKIRRRDFYRFQDLFLPKFDTLGLQGSIDITLNDRLHSNTPHLQALSTSIFDIAKKQHVGTFETAFGKIILDLTAKTGKVIDINQRFKELSDRRPPEAHAIIFAAAQNNTPIDPIEIIAKSNKSEEVVNGIKKRIQDAASNQLSQTRPGLITCFLEDVIELSSLAKESSLQLMSSYVLNKPENSHVAAILYRSEKRVINEWNAKRSGYQTLIFRNPHCRFEEIKAYPFTSKEYEF